MNLQLLLRCGIMLFCCLLFVVYSHFSKVRLCHLHPICASAHSPPPPQINFRNPGLIFMKLRMCVMVPDPISTACFVNPFDLSVCLCLTPIVSTQRLSENLLMLLGNG
jgi:hypothetical protein